VKYRLSYETRAGRCCWCWEPLPENDSHAVVRSAGGHPLELRFHHACWRTYRLLSGVEGGEQAASLKEWTPARAEALRLHAGKTLEEMATAVKVSKERLLQFMSGAVQLGEKPLARMAELAVLTRFDRDEPIDWSDRRAVFCLCMHAGWGITDLAGRMGVRPPTVSRWWDQGVPALSVRYRAMLTVIARQAGFDAGMVVDDRLWTPQSIAETIAASPYTLAEWAQAAGVTTTTLYDVRMKRRFSREAAWKLTRAAVRFGVLLPPVGHIAPKKRRRRPFPDGYNGPNVATAWTRDEIALVGRFPDAEVSRRLGGRRTPVAARRIRQTLGLGAVDPRHWDGAERDPGFTPDEMWERYQKYLRGEN
jgi:hypothetical protein